MDYPDVIDLRRQLFPERDAYHLIGAPLDDLRWLDEVPQDRPGLLRYLAVTCARGLRSSKKYGDVPNIVKKRLLWTTRPFPILVTLRRYSNVALWTQEKRLIDVFADEMSSELRKCCPEGFFERKLAKGNCLILLDLTQPRCY